MRSRLDQIEGGVLELGNRDTFLIDEADKQKSRKSKVGHVMNERGVC